MLYAGIVVVFVALDQIVKYLVRANIELGEVVDFIPHILGLSYIQNTGAAFSILSAHTWLLTLISAAASVGIAVAIWKNVFRHRAGKIMLSFILAGAVGNLIDRALFGFVTDMFKTLFMNFAVFNVADICIVCGGIAMIVYVLFFYDKLEGTDGNRPAES